MARLNNRQAKLGETKTAVAARLTDASLAYFTEPGESVEQATERKKILQEVKGNLK
jgi:hypothetical protein